MASKGPPPGAYAVVRGEDPALFLAENADVLARVLAIELVAAMPASDVSDPARLAGMRRALLEEHWADALLLWIEETNTPVDVYDTAPRVWTEALLNADHASMEIRMAPLFAE